MFITAPIKLSISIEAHLKLLKKLKSTIRGWSDCSWLWLITKQIHVCMLSGVDYRELVSGNEPLALLAPALTSSNVHSVAKLASLIPVQVSDYCNYVCIVSVLVVCLLSYQNYFRCTEEVLNSTCRVKGRKELDVFHIGKNSALLARSALIMVLSLTWWCSC